MASVLGPKELDARLELLRAKAAEEAADLAEEQRKLFEFEDKFLRDTLLEGNMLLGWGEPRSAPVRFRNAALRKKKRERQEASGARAPATPTLSNEERERVDRHRLASFSSLTSPAEPVWQQIQAKARGEGGARKEAKAEAKKDKEAKEKAEKKAEKKAASPAKKAKKAKK